MNSQRPISKSSGAKSSASVDTRQPTDDVQALLEANLNSLYTAVSSWFAEDQASASGDHGTVSPQALPSISNPRPSRLGLGATPAQTRALLNAEERRLRERVLGGSSAGRKRRGEFDHEADLVKSLNKKHKSSHAEAYNPALGSADTAGDLSTLESDEESSKTKSAASTTASSGKTRITSPERAAPRTKPATASTRQGKDALSAYLGGKSKKRRKKQEGGGSQSSAGLHPAIHPALLGGSTLSQES